jgi:hypothetical protein
MAVDVTGALMEGDTEDLADFARLFISHDHQDLGAYSAAVGALLLMQHLHEPEPQSAYNEGQTDNVSNNGKSSDRDFAAATSSDQTDANGPARLLNLTNMSVCVPMAFQR